VNGQRGQRERPPTQAQNQSQDLPESQLPSHPSTATATAPVAAALSDLQAQLHDTRTSLASHIDKMLALEGVFAEHDAIKREVGVLRMLVEKTTAAAAATVRGRERGRGISVWVTVGVVVGIMVVRMM